MRARRLVLVGPLLALIGAPCLGQGPPASLGPTVTPSAGPVGPVASASPAPTVGGLDPGGPLRWVRLDASGPGAREDHTLTVDPAGGSAWLFGGRDGSRTYGDLWRLDLAADTWERMDPVGPRPDGRFGHAASWLPGIGLVVFGGQAGSRFFDDLWAFDPITTAWRALPGAGARPEARYGTCAAVGPDGRLWISHGFTAQGRFGDTRAWDPILGRWTRETPREGPAPVDRCLHDCLWAPDGRLLLFGGQTNGVASLGDLWALDPAAGRWVELDRPAPGARRLYAVASDGPGAWLTGGVDAAGDHLDDLWWWDLAAGTWQRLAPLSERGPSARSGATLIVDAGRGRVLLFGGEGRGGARDDLWALVAAP